MARGNNRSNAVAPPFGFTPDDDAEDSLDLSGDTEDETTQSVDVAAEAALPEDENMESYESAEDNGTATEPVTPPADTAPVTPPASAKGRGYTDIPCLDTQAAAQVNAKFREGRRVEKLLIDGVYVYRLYD